MSEQELVNRVAELERRVAELEAKVPKQPLFAGYVTWGDNEMADAMLASAIHTAMLCS